MVDRSYLLNRPPRPSGLKRYVDQEVIPLAIDAAGALEAVLERLSRRAAAQPLTAAAAAFGIGLLGCLVGAQALCARRERRPARSRP
jgi:hypothetical protein